MKNRILQLISRLLNITTVIGTILFIVVNFENITYNTAQSHPEPTISINARYQYWLEDAYGTREGVEIYRKYRDFTVWMIEHHINEMIFSVIVLMILGSIWINKKLNKKMNEVLEVYLIFCLLLMLWTLFEAGPNYVDSIYDS
ncbi:MAG: hypothetical protein K6F17_06915 [Lachnospiraceae bacterium]|nr:hypothetical protein [Lachnospiraceae bacterium]